MRCTDNPDFFLSPLEYLECFCFCWCCRCLASSSISPCAVYHYDYNHRIVSAASYTPPRAPQMIDGYLCIPRGVLGASFFNQPRHLSFSCSIRIVGGKRDSYNCITVPIHIAGRLSFFFVLSFFVHSAVFMGSHLLSLAYCTWGV